MKAAPFWCCLLPVLLLGCGGSAYQSAMGPEEKDSGGAEGGGAVKSSAPDASAFQASQGADKAAGRTAQGQPAKGRPAWTPGEVPDVVPYGEPDEEPEPEPEGPVNTLPSGFFQSDPTGPSNSSGGGIPSNPAGPDNVPFISPPASPNQPSGPPPIPRANNPYGFPTGSNPAGAAVPAPGGVTSAAPSGPVSVRLHRAVALAQTLPTGTAMGFSVQYLYNSEMNPNAVYFWVIKPPRGEAVAMQVKLDKHQGALSTFVTQWGAVTGDYKMQIAMRNASGKMQPVSKPVNATYAR